MDSILYAKSWLEKHLSFAHFYTSLMEVINFDETFVSPCGLFKQQFLVLWKGLC